MPWSCVVINYNGASCILNTIISVLGLDVPPDEVIVVDDGSTDASPDLVQGKFPQTRIIRLPKNTGRTSIVRNTGLAAATHRYVLITDNDITFAPDAVQQMLVVLRDKSDAAICTPVVLFNDGLRQICNIGHNLHFTCWSSTMPTDLRALQARGPARAVGCGIQMVDRERLTETGMFDEDFVIGWGDDGELHHRVQLMGLACYSVPAAIVYHERLRSRARYYGQVHNRLLILLKTYRLRTLILLAPALIVFEAGLVVYLWLSGGFAEYRRAVSDIYALRGKIMTDRRRIQAQRRVGDTAVLNAGLLSLSERSASRATKVLGGLFSRVLSYYWAMVRQFA